jgi:hypothetical protein
MANKMDHITPDLSVKYDNKKAAAAGKKVESLKAEIADLNEQIKEKRKEMAVAAAESRTFAEPGFSNAKSAKEQTAENEATQTENAKTSTATKAK